MTDSPFLSLLERYRPPAEFNVFLPGDEAFVFRGLASVTEYEDLRIKIEKSIAGIRRVPLEQFKPFLVENDQAWRRAFFMQATMIGWYRSSKPVRKDGTDAKDGDDPTTLHLEPIGDRLEPLTQIEWLQAAAAWGSIFHEISLDWEMSQYRVLQDAKEDELEDQKKS